MLRVTSQYAEVLMQLAVPLSLNTTVITTETFDCAYTSGRTVTEPDLTASVTTTDVFSGSRFVYRSLTTAVSVSGTFDAVCYRSPSPTTTVTTTDLFRVVCIRTLSLTTTVATLISTTYIPGSVNMPSMYGTVIQSDVYFSTRLHSDVWDNSSTSDKTRALYTATRIIDRLNYKGYKHAVYLILEAAAEYDDVEQADRRVAEASQALEFPRDSDIVVPEDIKSACYEIAYALLDGIEPDIELENLGTTSQSFGGARTAYNRDQQPIEHILHGIPSAYAWRMLKPFLRDGRAITTVRVN